jgi:hypothetical protein
MLARNRDTGGISDQHFSDLAELAQLVENDLAVLLSERFEMASLMQAPRTTRRWPGLFQCRPRRCWPRAGGRGCRRSGVREGVRLVTLTGPGGVGKS